MDNANVQTKAWIVTVDMGYGHLRAAYPLQKFCDRQGWIVANTYDGIPSKDRAIWENSRKMYELISRFNNIPFFGSHIFNLFDKFQRILEFYPKRSLTSPSFQLKQTYKLIRKGWGKHLVEKLNCECEKPLITTFFIPAFMAEEHGFKNDIYIVVCDADISRTWAPLEPHKSKIKYLVPSFRAVERLKLYGVKKQNIFIVGFPLPEENLGGLDLHILRQDLARRIVNLDRKSHYREKYIKVINQFLYTNLSVNKKSYKPISLTFAVGGAGAQKNIAKQILFSLKFKLRENKVVLNLVAGSRIDVLNYFDEIIVENSLEDLLGKNIFIIYDKDKIEYFKKFNTALRKTDILWTKPSELSFYSALGLPIIMAPPIGSQEKFNREWLISIGAGIDQLNVKYTDEWLFDLLESDRLAEAAMSGFLTGMQFGTYNIKRVVFEKKEILIGGFNIK